MTDAPAIIHAHEGDDLRPVAGDWQLDPTHSSLEFNVRYAMFTTVRGRFSRFDGRVHLAPLELPATAVDVTIDAGSIESGLPARDDHLRSGAFFDIAAHPHIEFTARGAEVFAAGRYLLRGELTVRGVCQPVRLELDFLGQAPDIDGTPRLGFRATGRLARSEWGLTWNAPVPGGGVLLGEDVTLDLLASLVPADGEPPAPIPRA